jgi:hypothetical protein
MGTKKKKGKTIENFGAPTVRFGVSNRFFLAKPASTAVVDKGQIRVLFWFTKGLVCECKRIFIENVNFW